MNDKPKQNRKHKLYPALPYTHHGPTVYGSKIVDYLVSEAIMRNVERDLASNDMEGSGAPQGVALSPRRG